MMGSIYKWLVKLRTRTQIRYILALNKVILAKEGELVRLKAKLKIALKEEIDEVSKL